MGRVAVALVTMLLAAAAAVAFLPSPSVHGGMPVVPGARSAPSVPPVTEAVSRPGLAWGIHNLSTFYPITALAADPVRGTFLSLSWATLVVPGFNNATVNEISGANYSVLARFTVPVSTAPRLAVDSTTGDVLLTNVSGSILKLSGTTLGVLASLPVAPRVTGVLYDPVDRDVYVAEGCNPSYGVYGGNLTVVNASTFSVITTLPLPCSPTAMVADARSGNVFVLAGDPGNLTVVSGVNQTVLTTLPDVTTGPSSEGALTADPFLGRVYVKCVELGSPGCLLAVNGTTGAQVSEQSFGTVVQGGFVVDGNDHIVYLGWSNSSAGATEDLYVLPAAGGSVERTAHAPCPEDALTFNSVNRELVAAGHCDLNGHDGVVSFYSVGSYQLLSTVTLTNRSFVTSSGSEDLTAVDPDTGVTAASFSLLGFGSNLELVGPFPFTVHAAIWALGVNWTITLTHPSGFVEIVSTFDPSLTLYLPNGSYSYTLSLPPGYSASSDQGSFSVHGEPVDVSVTLSWMWWYWTILVVGSGVIVYAAVRGRRLRHEFFERRAPAAARLRYDIDHPLTPREETEPEEYLPP